MDSEWDSQGHQPQGRLHGRLVRAALPSPCSAEVDLTDFHAVAQESRRARRRWIPVPHGVRFFPFRVRAKTAPTDAAPRRVYQPGDKVYLFGFSRGAL